jgi:hypothetical protein
MAQLTYDPTPADQPEFNEAEQEALAIGEQAVADQQQMLAGKFKDAEALEQAYLELQKKLGESNNDDINAQEVWEEDAQRDDEEEVNPTFDLLTKASDEFYANDGKISEEVLSQLGELNSSDLVAAYIAMQGQQPEAEDLTEAEVSQVFQAVGGEEQYQALIDWAGSSMPDEFVQSFDNLVNTGDMNMIKLAVSGLQAAYQETNGYEGRMLSGKPFRETADAFRSQSEVVQAMSDPRYDRDPAYRQDVFSKLERSNLQY